MKILSVMLLVSGLAMTADAAEGERDRHGDRDRGGAADRDILLDIPLLPLASASAPAPSSSPGVGPECPCWTADDLALLVSPVSCTTQGTDPPGPAWPDGGDVALLAGADVGTFSIRHGCPPMLPPGGVCMSVTPAEQIACHASLNMRASDLDDGTWDCSSMTVPGCGFISCSFIPPDDDELGLPEAY